MSIFRRKPVEIAPIGDPKDLIYKLEFVRSYVNEFGNAVDLYLMYVDSRSNEMISLGLPHGRKDIAQYIQERLNKS